MKVATTLVAGLFVAATAMLALAPTASATGYLCTPMEPNETGGEKMHCAVFLYEGGYLLCVWGTREQIVPSGEPGEPTWNPDEYECQYRV